MSDNQEKENTMKKTIKIIILTALTLFVFGGGEKTKAQNFKPSGKTPSELSAAEIKNSAEGDFNKDGVKDLIISTDDGSAIYFGKSDGYQLFRDYNLTFKNDDKITVNDKGVIRIQRDFSGNSDVFLFRYQNDAFQLIGGKKDRHKSEHYDYSYNFSTGKMIKTDGEGANKKSETVVMPNQPPLKYGWFPLRWDVLDFLFEVYEDNTSSSPSEMLIFCIYRTMQELEMMHWSMCDYESYYGKKLPTEEMDGTWSALGIYESPGSYNSQTNLTISKLTNGTYKIIMNESFQDRSYESQINEDGSNLDELDIPDEEISKNVYIFDNGKFVEN